MESMGCPDRYRVEWELMFLSCKLERSTKLLRAKKPLNDSHEFHLDETRQDALKYGFGLVIDGKIDEVIHIQPKSQMLS